jgi:hypothetical protein
VAHDLPDLVDFLASNGCRIGEVMAVRASRLDLDVDVPACRIDGTVVRVKGRGLSIQEVPSREAVNGPPAFPLRRRPTQATDRVGKVHAIRR